MAWSYAYLTELGLNIADGNVNSVVYFQLGFGQGERDQLYFPSRPFYVLPSPYV